jgi:hypothetical protein
MKKIDKNQKKLVDELQNLISNWSRIQNELYNDLCKEIDHDSDWLYDYVFNTSSETDDEYKKLIEEKLFE